MHLSHFPLINIRDIKIINPSFDYIHYKTLLNRVRMNVELDKNINPASYPMGTAASFLEEKQPEREADHSPPPTAAVNAWSYTSTPPYVFMAWCLIKQARLWHGT
jgi:hypothetical protein